MKNHMFNLTVTRGPMKGKSYTLSNETIFVGRSSKNHVQIKDCSVSRMQLKISKLGNQFFVEDLKSTNGTRVNDYRIEIGALFHLGEKDIISFGNSAIRFN